MMNSLLRKVLTALFILGFTTILAQLILIRELLHSFQGNELIIGLILCIWMLLTAAGSRLGQHLSSSSGKLKIISRLLLVESILPAGVIVLLYVTDALIFPPGTSKGIIAICLFCLVLLSPGCLISGLLFTWLAAMLTECSGKNSVSKAYGWESVGSMVAALLFSLLLAVCLRTFQTLALIMLINLFVAWWLAKPDFNTVRKVSFLYAAWLILAIVLFIAPVDVWLKSLHYQNQQILLSKDTPLGNITVTETNGQYNFYEHGILFFSTGDHVLPEEAIHYAFLQHPRPEKVLIVSGGISEMAKQVLKYSSVTKMDYLEINPWLVKAEKQFIHLNDNPILKVNIIDARRWISETLNEYDVIVINSPDPSSAQLNRYFTLDFFISARKALRPHGVFSIALSPTVNYMSAGAKEVNRIIFHTLKATFKYAEVIPGSRNFYIASDDSLGLNIARRVQRAGIENDFVNQYYISDDLLKQQNSQIMENIAVPVSSLNTDIAPLAYFLQISYWINKYEGSKGMLRLMVMLLPLVLLVFIAIKRLSPFTSGVFTSGFAGASAEFIILIMYQIMYGNVYQMLGLIIALYMVGLTAGAMFRNRRPEGSTVFSYVVVQFMLMLAVMLVPLVIAMAGKEEIMQSWIIRGSLFLVTLAIAFFAGLTFNKATRLSQQPVAKSAGNLYAIDLAGAACGTLLTSLVCFPLLGLWLTCWFIAALVLIGIVVMLVFGKYHSS